MVDVVVVHMLVWLDACTNTSYALDSGINGNGVFYANGYQQIVLPLRWKPPFGSKNHFVLAGFRPTKPTKIH